MVLYSQKIRNIGVDLMRPHMAHINNTLIKKHLAKEAGDESLSYQKYMQMVNRAETDGWKLPMIIAELKAEKERIELDPRNGGGEPILQQGFDNAKMACINAINRIISELKGEI